MFKISQGKGFQITFSNGWTVSVQFGSGNYCENSSIDYNPFAPERSESKDAEIAAWDGNGEWHDFGHDTVKGYCSADEVADFIAMIKAKEPAVKQLGDGVVQGILEG
jgi:hypothetical protein